MIEPRDSLSWISCWLFWIVVVLWGIAFTLVRIKQDLDLLAGVR